MERVSQIIAQARPNLTNEKKTQHDLASALRLAFGDDAVRREVRLSDRDIIDIMVWNIGIEVKLKVNRRELGRQIDRYAGHEEVEGLLVATRGGASLPDTIQGKPVGVVPLSPAWMLA